MCILNAYHSVTYWSSGGGTSGRGKRVKKGQSLLSRIPESMRTDKFHRILIQWSGEYCKGVHSLHNLLQKYTGAITTFTKARGLGRFDRGDDTWTIL